MNKGRVFKDLFLYKDLFLFFWKNNDNNKILNRKNEYCNYIYSNSSFFLKKFLNKNKFFNFFNFLKKRINKTYKKGKINKLSCVLQLNEGVNIPGLKQGIIMHAYGNERKASQRIGRLLRLNPDDKAIVHILCYVNTVDEKWVKDALEDFNQNKIVWRNYSLQGT